jgi:pilus assembly protein CpaB
MKAKRLLLALLLALAVSGLFTLWISRRMSKQAKGNVAPQRMYVAASKALRAGETLERGDLQLISWPTALAGGFTKAEQVETRVVLFPLPPGEPILERQLAAPGAGSGLAAKIPTGMRAISVRSDEIVGVAGFVLPGSHVDVLMTYHTNNSLEPQTMTALQNVEVLAAGQQIQPQADGKPISVNVVTLLLKPEDAEKLVLVTSLGGIHLVLRNGADGEQTTNPPVGLPQLAGAFAPSPAPAAASPSFKPEHAAKPKPYEVETILGDKKVFNGFY